MTTAIRRSGPTTDVARDTVSAAVTVTQYSRRAIFAIWAAASLPMAALAWIVVPTVADGGGASLARALIVFLTIGLIWQFVLVLGLVGYEQRTLRWSRIREALWLRAPRNPKSGRVGGRTWLIVIPLILAFALQQLVPSFPAVAGRDLGAFLETTTGKDLFAGSWGWFAVALVMFVFNTVLGEELLFRGVLLPRMHGAFGNRDWIANGILFAGYHLHVPWAIPATLLDTFILSYPTKRYRSAWIGIAVHSAQSVVFALLLLTIVNGR